MKILYVGDLRKKIVCCASPREVEKILGVTIAVYFIRTPFPNRNAQVCTRPLLGRHMT